MNNGSPVSRSTHLKFARFCASFRLKTFGQVKIVMGVEAWDTAVMESSTASPDEKRGGSMASLMEIEGCAGVVMLMFVQPAEG
jgi:hypothetical protein